MKESEWLTRKSRIDGKLRSVNPKWEIVRYKDGMDCSKLSHHAAEEYPTANGFADYALFVDGRLLGVIEAKKVAVNPQNVLEQAKRYSRDVSKHSLRKFWRQVRSRIAFSRTEKPHALCLWNPKEKKRACIPSLERWRLFELILSRSVPSFLGLG